MIKIYKNFLNLSIEKLICVKRFLKNYRYNKKNFINQDNYKYL